jgi:formate dehydrogenase subunit gamma
MVADIVASLKHKPGALLPVLHEIQRQFGHVPEEAVELIARGLDLPIAEVHGVISFYHYFSTSPRGRHVVEICRAESCQAMGGRELELFAKQKLGLNYSETTADQQITLEFVHCLGNCACSPSVRVGTQIYGRMSSERFEALIDELGAPALEAR